MKKDYFASTALAAVLAAGLAGGAGIATAQTSKPTLTLGGSTEQEFGYGENKDQPQFDGFDQISEGEIHFNFSTTLDNGLKVSGRVELEGNTSSDQIDEHFMRLTGSFGEVTLGSEDNMANRLSVEPPQLGIGISEIDNWVEENGVKGFLTQDFDNASNDSEQIQYLTPSFGGFRAGVSYIPTWDQDVNNTPASKTAQYSEGVAAGIVFQRKFGAVNVETGINYLTFNDGPSAATAIGSPESINAGIKLGIGGFEIGVTGGTVDDMLRSEGTSSEFEDGEMYEIGIGYGQGPWKISVTYHHGEAEGLKSNPDDNVSDLFLIAGEYRLGPGVKVHGNLFYADWQGEDVDTATSTDDNEGFGAVIGFKVSF